MSDAERSQRAYARFAGLMFLVVLALSITGLVLASVVAGSGTFGDRAGRIVASEGLYRVGLVVSLAGSLSSILLAVGLYVATRPIDANLALMALLFRTGESVIGAAGIVLAFAVLHASLAVGGAAAVDASQLATVADVLAAGPTGEVAAIFFSLGSAIYFYVFLRSTFVPRALSAFGLGASLLYAAFWVSWLLVPAASALTVVGSVPILIAELLTGFWLLLRGIRPQHSS